MSEVHLGDQLSSRALFAERVRSVSRVLGMHAVGDVLRRRPVLAVCNARCITGNIGSTAPSASGIGAAAAVDFQMQVSEGPHYRDSIKRVNARHRTQRGSPAGGRGSGSILRLTYTTRSSISRSLFAHRSVVIHMLQTRPYF